MHLITILCTVIWGLLIIVFFHSFIKTFFIRKIRKVIVEDRVIYKVLVINRRVGDLPKA